jgi:two-component system, OmpR family, alkaline phosphatase synthesis response regulator PhoP
VSDAWIYTADNDLGAELCRLLAELGFSPRRVSANGTLLPAGDGGDARRPSLVVVAAGPDEPAPDALVSRLVDHDELGEVPLVAALDAEHLDNARCTLDAAQELLVLPFAAEEVKARVARARRQVNGVGDDDVVRAGSLELNLATYQVRIAERPVSFAFMEYELLKFLMTHPNRVFSREALLSAVWGYDYYGGARTVDVHVRRVRAKLGNEHATRIKTVRSVGYRFEL